MKIVQIAAGRNHSLVLTIKGDVYASGSDRDGQLGIPDKLMRTNFQQVVSLISVNVVKLYAGGLHSWMVLDEVMPKKDDFKEGKEHESTFNDDEYLLNDDDSLNQISNFGENPKGKPHSVNSNFSNFQNMESRHSKFGLLVNYTDTNLSHRFIRFEVPQHNIQQAKAKVEEFIAQNYKEETGT
mmetsp:Transcript_32026/g.31329  ORF Transcript_32026/g.31329 Transcript_32026/m.31329 type:complete len:183 (+) Transcript_32026:1234-1782(+)